MPYTPTLEELDKCNRQASRDGLLAGVTGGLVASIYGQRILKLPPKKAWISGLFAGVLSGYFFSQAFLASYMEKLRLEGAKKATVSEDFMPVDDSSPNTMNKILV